ncbi:MAG: hypothetical protein JXR36_01245 [Bacteroidales bacterium]|nr:hypothetical protein [Bacteroidales bacterium]
MGDFRQILKSPYFKITMILLVLVVVVLIVKAVLEMFSKRDSYTRESRQEYSNSNLSYTDLEYENMAARLLDAMSGAMTREEPIYQILKSLKTKDDWYKLVNVFGVRETTSMWSSWSGNLVEWLVDELDSSEQEEVSNILSRIGVVF